MSWGRRTHEDRVEDSVTDVDGKERFCLVATVTDINLFGIPYYAVYSILNSSMVDKLLYKTALECMEMCTKASRIFVVDNWYGLAAVLRTDVKRQI